MERLWKGGMVRDESGMFAGKPRIDLMFPAERIAQVTLHGSGEVFEAGKDYRHATGDDFITRTENSRIPYLPPEALRPAGAGVKLYPAEDANAVGNADGGRNIALADVHKVWRKFLERKSFYDLTGNGVNHPNDYGHRIYASVVLELLTGKKYFD